MWEGASRGMKQVERGFSSYWTASTTVFDMWTSVIANIFNDMWLIQERPIHFSSSNLCSKPHFQQDFEVDRPNMKQPFYYVQGTWVCSDMGSCVYKFICLNRNETKITRVPFLRDTLYIHENEYHLVLRYLPLKIRISSGFWDAPNNSEFEHRNVGISC